MALSESMAIKKCNENWLNRAVRKPPSKKHPWKSHVSINPAEKTAMKKSQFDEVFFDNLLI